MIEPRCRAASLAAEVDDQAAHQERAIQSNWQVLRSMRI